MTTQVELSLDIEPAHFFAVAVFRAHAKDVRRYLTGVCVDTGPKGAFLIASDGHAIAVHCIHRDPLPEASIVLPESLIVQLESAKCPVIRVCFSGEGNAFSGIVRSVSVTAGPVAVTVPEIEAIYPDWRRVARHTPSPEHVFYSPDLIARVHKAGRKLRGAKDKIAALIVPGGAKGPGFAALDVAGRTCAWVMPLLLSADDLRGSPDFSF